MKAVSVLIGSAIVIVFVLGIIFFSQNFTDAVYEMYYGRNAQGSLIYSPHDNKAHDMFNKRRIVHIEHLLESFGDKKIRAWGHFTGGAGTVNFYSLFDEASKKIYYKFENEERTNVCIRSRSLAPLIGRVGFELEPNQSAYIEGPRTDSSPRRRNVMLEINNCSYLFREYVRAHVTFVLLNGD